jgi:signal transduction histidine kinase
MFWRRHLLITQGYLIVAWGLWLVLLQFHSLSWFLLFGLTSQLYMLTPRLWKLPGLVILTALTLWQVITRIGINNGIVLLILSSAAVGLFIALEIEIIHRRNWEKGQLLSELEATRQELVIASQQAGAVQERQRLAYEIHDTLAQGFMSIIMHAEAAESTLPASAGNVQRYLDQIRRTARENLSEARRLMWALQPEALERASLPDVLSHLCRKWSEEQSVAVDMIITGSRQMLRPEIEVTLLRATQEGLANVSKHARASQVTVTLSYIDDMVVLDVQDDGVGFDPEQMPLVYEHTSSGFGLKALRERAEHLGGTLSVESIAGEGTTLAMVLPALPVCSNGVQES